MPGREIEVLLCDDHAIVREGLRMLLGDADGITVVGEADNGAEATEKAEHLSPDVILMDVCMPQLDGIAAAHKIREQSNPPNIVLLTSSLGDDLRLQEALDAGVTGYLLKDISQSDLVSAIKNAAAGSPTFHPEVQRQLLRRATGEKLPHETLTGRERDILIEIGKGKSNKAIAFDLGLTEGTVKGHVSTVLAKLGVADRTQAALYAVKHGLVEI